MNDNFQLLLSSIAILLPSFMATLTFRGFFRSLAASIAGDKTAKEAGFLTLNPAAHIDALGVMIFAIAAIIFSALFPDSFSIMFLFILLMFLGVRWSFEPPIDERNFKNYKLGVTLVAIAGPIGNFLLALVAIYLFKYLPYGKFASYVSKSFIEVLGSIINLSIFYGVLNLIPLPPFDCGKLLPIILPKSLKHLSSKIEEYAVFIFIALILLGSSIFISFISLLSLIVKKLLLSFLVF